MHGVTITAVRKPSRRPVGHHHGDLRHALEQAALALVAEQGPRGFTLAEASRRAGVSVAAPYKHFADRDALLAALAERGYVEQQRRFAIAIAASSDPVEQLARFAAAYVQFAAEERALFEITFSAGLNKARYPALAAAGDAVLDVLREPAEQLRGTADEALALIHAVGATSHGFATLLLQGVFGPPASALEPTRDRASAVARLLAAGRQAAMRQMSD